MITRATAEAAIKAHQRAARLRQRSEALELLSRANYLSATGEANRKRLRGHVYGGPVDAVMVDCPSDLTRDELALLGLSWIAAAGASDGQLEAARALLGFPLGQEVCAPPAGQRRDPVLAVRMALANLDRAGLTPRQIGRIIEVLTWDEPQDPEAAP